MAHLITASSGTPHITPKSDASWHRGVMGVENCILDFGEKLAPMLVPSQPTNIRILDGVGMFQGRFFEIESGSYDTIAIPNGAQGYSRIDLVCAKITQNENGTQTFSWEVVQGTQTEGTPTPPEVEEGSLDDGDEYALMPIASVELEGVNIVAVETVAEIGRTVSDDIRKVVPLREGEFMEVKKLLWTNPNPSASFVAQTILNNGELNGFDAVEIYFKGYYAHPSVDYSHKIKIGDGQSELGGITENEWISLRAAQATTSGVVFKTGRISKLTTGVTNDDGWAVPVKIYGIKHI